MNGATTSSRARFVLSAMRVTTGKLQMVLRECQHMLGRWEERNSSKGMTKSRRNLRGSIERTVSGT